MANANVTQFTDANFQAEVLQSDLPVLVDFWAEWCMPCKMPSPTIAALAEEFKGRIGEVDRLEPRDGREVRHFRDSHGHHSRRRRAKKFVGLQSG